MQVTQKHISQALGKVPFEEYTTLAIFNKAIEIALAEQKLNNEISGMSTEAIESYLNVLTKDKSQEQYITADEARKLGAGKAEWKSGGYADWQVCGEDFQYFSIGVKYRAIKQPEPSASTNFQYDGHTEYSNTEPVEPKICTIKNLDTGIISTMTREAAKLLQAELGDTVEWFIELQTPRHKTAPWHPIGFDKKGIYTYKLRPLKQISWKDVPVGVMTKDGEFRGITTDNYLIIEQLKVKKVSNYRESAELAPADQQPWIPVIAPPEGITVEYSRFHECLRITGIAKGYSL